MNQQLRLERLYLFDQPLVGVEHGLDRAIEVSVIVLACGVEHLTASCSAGRRLAHKLQGKALLSRDPALQQGALFFFDVFQTPVATHVAVAGDQAHRLELGADAAPGDGVELACTSLGVKPPARQNHAAEMQACWFFPTDRDD